MHGGQLGPRSLALTQIAVGAACHLKNIIMALCTGLTTGGQWDVLISYAFQFGGSKSPDLEADYVRG